LGSYYNYILDRNKKERASMDNVNHPAHYGQGKIECIEYIEDFLSEDEYIGYLRGNIAKYNHRWRYKGGIEDVRKAIWYSTRLELLLLKKEKGS
jgi:hypothetical protein